MGKRKAAALAATAVFTALVLFPSFGENAQIKEEQEKKSALEEEKEKVEAVLKDLESLKSDTAAYVQRLDQDLNALNSELTQLEGQIAAKETDIEAAQAELTQAEAVEEQQYESMKLRIKYMYEAGGTSFMDVLLDAGSISDFLNRTEYISEISKYDREKLDEYVMAKDTVEKKKAELEYEHSELVSMEEATQAKQASVETLMNEKTAELESYEAQIDSAENEISEYEKDIKAQEEKIQAIEAEIRRQEEEARKKAEAEGKKYNTVSIGDISFIWPCPSSSRITSPFGGRESPTAGASTNHQGVDIGASSGSDILAAAAGEVIISTYSYSAGNYIMINHGGGVYTVYMHCSQLLASVGQQVKQGEVIAKVGSTGYSTGPHLHFGIRTGGKYVNPLNYVSP
ncbi:MAG TPA: peptidoglycan DD-metalloendopeptidase family protein [Candidatus Lachnoclostridium stercoravium]|mgnify:CR=1 FL=1|uniref:Peptidoglycan DD-metalloendopeptidase family protein n=1 Tax=Candidatus Lachnoclostridium stercoravium TaxID=2838633 RepID=A0A9D2HHB3_9FIRM|nr:peptidoglycan DD-metalloendopeptidase family protein [Candidatus Lachnoclostridium stercoravium]